MFVDAGEAVKGSFKQLLVPGMLFEELGLKYVGPIDGHDVGQVQAAVERAKANDGPVIIHAVTRKGQGYPHAEEQPDAFHGIGPFTISTGKTNGSGGPISFTEAFSRALVAEAAKDERIVAITAAMPSGTGLDRFAEEYPGPLLRRRHRRGARRGYGSRSRGRRPAAGDRDLLDVHAARLRPDDHGRRPAEPARGLLPRSRRACRRGRADTPRRLRPELPALDSQHDGARACRRGRVGRGASHGACGRGTGRHPLPARRRSRRRDTRRA